MNSDSNKQKNKRNIIVEDISTGVRVRNHQAGQSEIKNAVWMKHDRQMRCRKRYRK